MKDYQLTFPSHFFHANTDHRGGHMAPSTFQFAIGAENGGADHSLQDRRCRPNTFSMLERNVGVGRIHQSRSSFQYRDYLVSCGLQNGNLGLLLGLLFLLL